MPEGSPGTGFDIRRLFSPGPQAHEGRGVLFLATPNTLALDLDTLESVIGRTSGQLPSDG